MADDYSGAGAAGNPEMVPLEWLDDVNRKGIVKWVGRLPYQELLQLLDNASVVVLPSSY